MTDYGKGQVLGASILPATSAFGLVFADMTNPAVLGGFIVLNILWLVLLTGQISRFLVNRAK